jgi:hypothetical protein
MITNAKAAHVEWLSIFIASIQLSATLQIFTGWMDFITDNFRSTHLGRNLHPSNVSTNPL